MQLWGCPLSLSVRVALSSANGWYELPNPVALQDRSSAHCFRAVAPYNRVAVILVGMSIRKPQPDVKLQVRILHVHELLIEEGFAIRIDGVASDHPCIGILHSGLRLPARSAKPREQCRKHHEQPNNESHD